MKQVWSDENKYRMWLNVELAVCEAWTEVGAIPLEDMESLRSAAYDHDRMMEIHRAARETLPENYVHNSFLPFHAGAVLYLEDRGFDVPDDLEG